MDDTEIFDNEYSKEEDNRSDTTEKHGISETLWNWSEKEGYDGPPYVTFIAHDEIQ